MFPAPRAAVKAALMDKNLVVEKPDATTAARAVKLVDHWEVT